MPTTDITSSYAIQPSDANLTLSVSAASQPVVITLPPVTTGIPSAKFTMVVTDITNGVSLVSPTANINCNTSAAVWHQSDGRARFESIGPEDGPHSAVTLDIITNEYKIYTHSIWYDGEVWNGGISS